jgi:CRISPR-associated endonuclease Cas1
MIPTEQVQTFPCLHGVLLLRGFSLRLAVERGHLIIEDESLGIRRRTRLNRVDRGVRRIIIVGSTGSLSLEVIRWLDGVGIPLVHVHPDGRVLMVAAPSAAHRPPVRRAQALAATTDLGLSLSRQLLLDKIRGQVGILDPLDAAREVRQEMALALGDAEAASDFDSLRRAEALAASAYWGAWRTVRVRILNRDRRRVPAHWGRFSSRHSPLGGRGPIRAVTPANAILNYCYAILEAEARIACLAVGLDPMLGLLHTDRTARDALALDLMEPIRPAVDHFVLDLLAERELSRKDLFELADGQCRLLPPLTEELATIAPRWARLVLPVAQWVADRLERAVDGGMIPRPNHHGKAPRSRRRPQIRSMREYDRRPDPTADVRYREKAVRKRQRTLTAVYEANGRWRATQVPTMTQEEYRARVAPALAGIALRRLMDATGLSNASCSKIRRGLTTPHPRHWEPLARVVGANA